MKRSLFLILIVASVLIIIGPVLFFVFKLGSTNVSRNLSEWSNFSNYWSAFINLANLIVISVLSYLIFRFDQNRHRESEKRENILDRPLLAFIKNTHGIYYVKNVGKGAAINIILKSNYVEQSQKWEHVNVLYSLKEGDSLILEWIPQSSMFIAKYQDVFDNSFYSYMKDDTMTFMPESEIIQRASEHVKLLFDKQHLIP